MSCLHFPISHKAVQLEINIDGLNKLIDLKNESTGLSLFSNDEVEKIRNIVTNYMQNSEKEKKGNPNLDPIFNSTKKKITTTYYASNSIVDLQKKLVEFFASLNEGIIDEISPFFKEVEKKEGESKKNCEHSQTQTDAFISKALEITQLYQKKGKTRLVTDRPSFLLTHRFHILLSRRGCFVEAEKFIQQKWEKNPEADQTESELITTLGIRQNLKMSSSRYKYLELVHKKEDDLLDLAGQYMRHRLFKHALEISLSLPESIRYKQITEMLISISKKGSDSEELLSSLLKKDQLKIRTQIIDRLQSANSEEIFILSGLLLNISKNLIK